jgi:hypothetical protein
MLDESKIGEINALAITESGKYFVSGGYDKRVKLSYHDEKKSSTKINSRDRFVFRLSMYK